MTTSISKSQFKSRALELFREVERTGQAIVITDRGTPVLQVTPYRADPLATLRVLRESVVKYDAPTAPVGDDDWEASR